MADGVTITPGVGMRIAADEVIDQDVSPTEPAQFQWVKLVDGTPEGTIKVGATARGLKVENQPAAIGETDRSGIIATGGVAQQLMPANPARRGWSIQNVSDTTMWFTGLGYATMDSPAFKLVANALYESQASFVSTSAISIICETSGKKFSAREW